MAVTGKDPRPPVRLGRKDARKSQRNRVDPDSLAICLIRCTALPEPSC